MATATTTAQLIREDRRDIVQALTPAQLAKTSFREYRDGDLRTWAETKPASCLRRFQIRDLSTYEPPLISDAVLEEQTTEFEIVVAYPVSNKFGGDAINGLEDAIRADYKRISQSLGILSNAQYPAGLQLFRFLDHDIEREEQVWFSVSTYEVNFREAIELVAAAIELRIAEDGVTRLTEDGTERAVE